MIKRIKFETKIDYNGQIISDEDERIALNANKITKEGKYMIIQSKF